MSMTLRESAMNRTNISSRRFVETLCVSVASSEALTVFESWVTVLSMPRIQASGRASRPSVAPPGDADLVGRLTGDGDGEAEFRVGELHLRVFSNLPSNRFGVMG